MSSAAFSPTTNVADPLALTTIAEERDAAADKEASRSLVQQRPVTPTVVVTPTKKPSPKPSATTKKTTVRPMAGFDQKQMNNAATIVSVGRSLGLPKRALIIGVATAIQESSLYNQASEAVPESFDYPHEGDSVDHDSVGIFQQRTSAGWGTVANLMKPAYQAKQFFNKLKDIDWQDMSLTEAAQTVQVSAYPDAYAKHEDDATAIVTALLA